MIKIPSIKHTGPNISPIINYDLELIEKVLKLSNKSLSKRAEELTIDDFINISNEIVLQIK